MHAEACGLCLLSGSRECYVGLLYEHYVGMHERQKTKHMMVKRKRTRQAEHATDVRHNVVKS